MMRESDCPCIDCLVKTVCEVSCQEFAAFSLYILDKDKGFEDLCQFGPDEDNYKIYKRLISSTLLVAEIIMPKDKGDTK